MTAKRILRTMIILVVLITTIGCDQVSKNIIRRKLSDSETLTFMHDRLTIRKVENTGAFLSAGSSLPEPIKTILLTGLPVVVLTLALLYLFTQRNITRLSVVGICFVVGGGVGNIFDRVMYGSVTDFMHIDFVVFETGIFNMADVSIMTGMAVILFEIFYQRAKHGYQKADA